MNFSDIPKAYNPSEVEDKWYGYWLEKDLFRSEVDESKKPYTIVIPPPNVTGSLTMGHILNNTIQDILIRTKRMQGHNACWVPGTDHASIATEAKVVVFLKEQEIDKRDIGREEFLKHCWEWKEKYGGIIIQQLKKLGVSCDWQRERFTMDDHYYKKVIETFVALYKEGKIYRGYRMVNWDPVSRSAISDEEVIYRTVNGKLWYLKYPVRDSGNFIIVATTRPETMLGDTGIAVNPEDERYKKFIGRKVILPIVNREIPIFADEYVDKDFGTGAVKVTPAHDINDYEMGKRHNLETINIFNEDATTNENVPDDLKNLDRFEVRKKVVEKFEKLGLLEKIEDYQTSIGYSERGGVPIEPYLSEQWFMKMNELSKPALKVVKEGKIKFHPAHWVKTYDHWMSNINDWCISRQLWWGHRIPVWYCIGDDHCEPECKKPMVSVNVPEKCPHCGSKNLKQDEDVLDTWASSWLWAYDVFKTEEEQNYYYPTNTLVTAPDIIFFWVARMIMAGLHFKKDIPFSDVYFTSIIRDVQGRKMSKSLGNSPDPLDVIKDYGADALRFTVIYLAPLGQDVLFSDDKCEIGRNFANKIWNAGRFLLMNKENINVDESLAEKHIDFSDEWITSRFHQTLQQLNDAMEKFEINNATKIIYSYVWNDFCDWYIELMKNRIYTGSDEVKSAVLTRALSNFENLLKIVHPFMPFITEALWQLIKERKEGESISVSEYPEFNFSKIIPSAEKEMEFVQDVISALRNIRGEMNIPPSKQVNAFIKSSQVADYQVDYIKKLAKVDEIRIDKTLSKPKASASAVVKETEIYVPLEGLIDLDVERSRLQKEITRLEGAMVGIDKKLSNEKFVNNAAPEVVEKEKMKKKDWETNLIKLKEILSNLN
ncbi:MAG: valine--tRNA ligase [Ignavibacteria bacterium GWC2_36_12]|nr:MAG: valine--tRNA ligase [Ignavibacteria bacterium GWC2_36_12]OGV03655.1 MAG: valine--tRNA ligase [Ignavibacteria bacterium RIFOXYB2_FULL_36_7]